MSERNDEATKGRNEEMAGKVSTAEEGLESVARRVVGLWNGGGKCWTGEGWIGATDESHVMLFVGWGNFAGKDEGAVAEGFFRGAEFMPWKLGASVDELVARAKAEAEKAEAEYKKAWKEWNWQDYEGEYVHVTCPCCGEDFFVDDDGNKVDPQEEWRGWEPQRRGYRRKVIALVGAERKPVLLDALLLAKVFELAAMLGGVVSAGMAVVLDHFQNERPYDVFFVSGGCWKFAILPARLQDNGPIDGVAVEWQDADGKREEV